MNDTHASQRPPRQKRRLLLVIVVLALIALIAFGFWHFRSGSNEQGQAKAPGGRPFGGGAATAVAAIAAEQQDFPIYLTALGTVTPLHSIEVRSRVEGELVAVNFEEGQYVEKGQTLAQIDARGYQADLDQAQAQLKEDQAQLASARQDLARYQKLIKSNYISRQELETQQQLVKQYEGAVEADKASIQNARVSLDYTTVVAPVDGIIGIRNVDPGNVVQLGDENPIATLTQLDPISVIFSMPSKYLASLRQRQLAGEDIDVTALNSDETQTLSSGTLTSIDSAIDTATGTIRMRARFDNDATTLFPNEFVNVRLTQQTLHDTVVVPETAIQTSQDGTYVYVVGADNKVTRRAVTLSASDDTHAAVASGVEAGEQVVVDGVDNLRDGASVRVVSHSLPGDDTNEATSPASPSTSDSAQDPAS
ncbi:MdtA/MuxA family multidrug efflux RND transporter periplasmic adaptor subunit [Phytohalomonas tamaricis]|uniref:MdtA/MuxA family multidrug efflux RND transporter periplasmic adaptor subunit n=1 Tax=Phytohalomonas tamaricis TaxID=2081032 RepID=UPI000D0B34AB|nr:MdtA/MuxA family multidrug efflux RND transporter periplasmic adaptor subunit [Phytohalomonas tamaricis]